MRALKLFLLGLLLQGITLVWFLIMSLPDFINLDHIHDFFNMHVASPVKTLEIKLN